MTPTPPASTRAVADANEAQSELATAITMSPECFRDPRTFNVDGIRFGLVTKPGRVEIIDEEATIAAIKSKYAVLADTLIVVKETVNKKALENLTTEQLERIGLARGVADPNAIVIKPTDRAVDKLVKALLEDVKESTTELVA
jgi:hypothetical protein